MVKALRVSVVGAVFLVFIIIGANGPSPARAAAPALNISWGNPAVAGWAFGDTTRTISITTDAASVTSTWHYDLNGVEMTRDGVITDNGGGSYTATFTLTGTGQEVGVIEVTAIGALGERTMSTEYMLVHNLSFRNKPAAAQCDTPDTMTTDVSAVTDFRNVALTLACPGKGSITFYNGLDLTRLDAMNYLRNFGQYMDQGANPGKFGLDISVLNYLADKGARVTIYLPSNINYKDAPDIKMNDGDASGVVSDVTYDTATRAVTFTAAHFSTFAAVPKVTLTGPTNNSSTTSDKLTVKGTVNDIGASIKIYVGSTDQGAVTVDSDGAFSKEVTLANGSNTITVASSNSIGSGYDVTRTVTYSALPASGVTAYILYAIAGLIIIGLVLVATAKKSA